MALVRLVLVFPPHPSTYPSIIFPFLRLVVIITHRKSALQRRNQELKEQNARSNQSRNQSPGEVRGVVVLLLSPILGGIVLLSRRIGIPMRGGWWDRVCSIGGEEITVGSVGVLSAIMLGLASTW